ncbi:MAG: hypothetical protein U0800_22780 [Isosphaeraceae bacterium]
MLRDWERDERASLMVPMAWSRKDEVAIRRTLRDLETEGEIPRGPGEHAGTLPGPSRGTAYPRPEAWYAGEKDRDLAAGRAEPGRKDGAGTGE